MECPNCPEINLGEWSEILMAQLGGRRYPLGATFEITERCNLDCVHCFIHQSKGCKRGRNSEMSLDEIKRILDQMAEAGVINLLLTGGEVFVRPDFLKIYQHAKQLGMLVMVFTNGTLITEEIADFFAEWPPYFIEISSYGHTQETYESITQVPGSFSHYRNGIDLLLDRGLSLGLKTVVMTVNRHELDQMRAFAESLGVRFRFDGMIWPKLDGDKGPVKYRLSPKEIVDLDFVDLQRWDNFVRMHKEKDSQYSRSEYVYSCGAGYYGFHVDASGNLSMCMMSRQPSYDLRMGNLEKGWNYLKNVREKKRVLPTPCRTCTAGMMCNQCPGWSQIVHGDDETLVDFICETAHLRLQYFSLLENHLNEKEIIHGEKESLQSTGS
jgi:radical SAM protein with 4Fe4S-binding SPASM domain